MGVIVVDFIVGFFGFAVYVWYSWLFGVLVKLFFFFVGIVGVGVLVLPLGLVG